MVALIGSSIADVSKALDEIETLDFSTPFDMNELSDGTCGGMCSTNSGIDFSFEEDNTQESSQ